MKMAMGLRYHNDNSLDVFLTSMVTTTEEARTEFLKEAAEETKAAVIKYIPRAVKHKQERVRLADDVKAEVVEDKIYGGKKARIRGSKKTGTLWHLVNDGTYCSRPTHFMDKAMSDMDGFLEGLLDKALEDL